MAVGTWVATMMKSPPSMIEAPQIQGAVLETPRQIAARALGPIGAILAESGHTADGLEVYPVNLERVFMHLTGKELRD